MTYKSRVRTWWKPSRQKRRKERWVRVSMRQSAPRIKRNKMIQASILTSLLLFTPTLTNLTSTNNLITLSYSHRIFWELRIHRLPESPSKLIISRIKFRRTTASKLLTNLSTRESLQPRFKVIRNCISSRGTRQVKRLIRVLTMSKAYHKEGSKRCTISNTTIGLAQAISRTCPEIQATNLQFNKMDYRAKAVFWRTSWCLTTCPTVKDQNLMFRRLWINRGISSVMKDRILWWAQTTSLLKLINLIKFLSTTGGSLFRSSLMRDHSRTQQSLLTTKYW